MTFHDLKFIRRQLAGLELNAIGDTHLANVMQGAEL
jgi:hypothetical protein